jgi:hypothetical protein
MATRFKRLLPNRRTRILRDNGLSFMRISRRPQQIKKYSSVDDSDDRLLYTVPPLKTLYIEYWEASFSDPDKNIVELHINGVACSAIGAGKKEASGGDSINFPADNPMVANAGEEIRIVVAEGKDDKDWSCAFIGYLEDN